MWNKIKDKVTLSNCLLVLFIMFLCSPVFYYDEFPFVSDVTLQIKSGIFMLDNHTLFNNDTLVNGDIFSWHDVNWIPHEQGWYLLLGIAYKLGGCIGVVWLSCIIGCITVLISIYLARIKQKSSLLSIIVVVVLSSMLFGLPGISYRPDTISLLFLAIELLAIMYCNNIIVKGAVLVLCSFLTAWFHGGIIIVIIAVIGVWIIVDFIKDKNFKRLLINSLILVLSFIASLCTNIGFSIWTYNSKQSMYPELRKYQGEWQPGQFSVLLIVFLLCILIGLMNKHIVDMNKNELLSFMYVCMFIVGFCIYVRLGRQLCVVLLITGPKALDNFITLVKDLLKLNKETNKKSKKHINKNTIKQILILIMLPVLVISNVMKLDYSIASDINDAYFIYGYDLNCVNFIKEKDYKRIYAPMTYSTMFIWNDIKTATDVRWDPFLKSISGIDYMHNKFLLNNPVHLGMFVDEFNPDALLFAYIVDSGVTTSGEQYDKTNEIECLIDVLDDKYSDIYKKVYDNTSVGHIKSIDFDGNIVYNDNINKKFRWVIYEPISN